MKSCRYASGKGASLTPFRVMHRMLWGALLATVLVACGGGGGSKSGSGGSGAGPVSLKDVLARPLGQEVTCRLQVYPTAATPGEVVTITGLPDSFGEPGFRVMAETDQGEMVIAPLFANQPADNSPVNEVEFAAPVHPVNIVNGGKVNIEIGDGKHHCAPFEFTVNPLPEPASQQEKDISDPQQVLSKLQAWVDRNIQRLGYDPDAIMGAAVDDVPPQQMGLWIAKKIVSGTDPGALPAITQSVVDSGDDVLPRLLLASGLGGDLNDAIEALNNSSLPDGTIVAADNSRSAAVVRRASVPEVGVTESSSMSVRSMRSSSAQCGDTIEFDPDKLQIDSTDDLALRMRLAREGMIPDRSTSGKVLAGITLAPLFTKNITVGVTANVADYAGNAMTAVSYVEKARLALEPKRISSFTVEPGNNVWVEDRPATETETAWISARVNAEGDSFNVSKVILESMITAYGMMPGPVGVATTVDSITTEYVQGAVDDITSGACIRVSAPTYGPYSVSDADTKQWTTVDVEGDTIALDPSNSHKFYGVSIGQSAIRVELNSNKFPLPFPSGAVFPIFVQPVALMSTPPSHRVEIPGEEFAVSARATNAYTGSVGNISAAVQGAGSIVNQAFNSASDELEVTYKAPGSFDDLPAAVVFNWTGKTLPGGSSGSRSAETGFDNKGKITLSPDSACVMPGDELSLTATIEGLSSSDSIAWLGNVRSLDENNLTQTFTAPNQPGTYKVRAFDSNDEDVFDEVDINVSQTCLKKAWLAGGASTLDGNGIYSSYTDCAVDSESDVQGGDNAIEPDPGYPLPPAVPGDIHLWFDDSESTGGSYLHHSSRWKKDKDGVCQKITLGGENHTEITFFGGSDSTLSYHADIDMTADCKTYPDGDVECSGPGATLSGQGFYYLDVSDKKTVRMTGELSCAMLSGKLTAPAGYVVSASVMRYAEGQMVPLGGVSNPDGSMRSPLIFEKQCFSANDVATIDETFVLDAPAQAGATDTVILHIMLPAVLISAGGTPATVEEFGAMPVAPQEGTYTAKGQLDFSVKVN